MGDQWVRLPKGAQVTMSRDQVRAMQGLGIGGRAIMVVLIIALVWVLGQMGDDTTSTDNKPTRPGPSATAPAKAGE